MASELQHSMNSSLAAGEIISPLSAWVLFWRPRYQHSPVDLVSVPFLFWLTYTLRPGRIVTVGDRNGTAHFALCQAVEKLDLDSRCLGIGPWSSDHGVPVSLQTYNDETYPDLSRLRDEPAARAARHLPEGSVDLVLLSLGASENAQEVLSRLDTIWLPRLSARGVVVLTGVRWALEGDEMAPELDRLLQKYPYFHLEAGEGLLLVSVGDTPEDRLRRLCDIQDGSAPGYAGITHVFAQIGRGLRAEAAEHEAARRLSALERESDAHGSSVTTPPPVPLDTIRDVPAEDPLTVLTEAFERQQIASDARIAELRQSLDQVRRERDALETLLKDTGVDPSGPLAKLRRPSAGVSPLAHRLEEQQITLAKLRNALVPRPLE